MMMIMMTNVMRMRIIVTSVKFGFHYNFNVDDQDSDSVFFQTKHQIQEMNLVDVNQVYVHGYVLH